MADYAELANINSNLQTINNNIHQLYGEVEGVRGDVTRVQSAISDVDSRLDSLVAEFRDFVAKDIMAKEMQLAETRVVKVRQELNEKYGYYSKVRRVALGILQASDVSVVRKEIVNTATEELMLQAPRYWLAPCLIALAAWLNNNKDLAERSLQEAIRRNDERTSLFFALVARRASRYDLAEQWLERYLFMQDPTSLERDMMVVLDAFASGLFGSDSTGICSKRIQDWVEELSNRVGFVDEQRAQWVEAFKSKLQSVDSNDYPYLKTHSPTWPKLKEAMRGVQLHRTLKDHFTNILNTEIGPAQALAFKVDEILENLVKNFDTEELPLRREERLMQLIVECNGDRPLAMQRWTAEKSLEKTVDFTQLLTNAAMHRESAGASIATQRLAVALSKEWIKDAYRDLTAQVRSSVPAEIEVEISDWKGVTKDGRNEEDLVSNLRTHMANWYSRATYNLKFGATQYIVLGIIGLVALLCLFGKVWVIALLALAGGAIYFFVSSNNIKQQKSKITDRYNAMSTELPQLLKAVLAEVVDWRKHWAEADSVSKDVGAIFEQISPAQFISSSISKAKVVL